MSEHNNPVIPPLPAQPIPTRPIPAEPAFQPILETTYVNPNFDMSNPSWAENVCSGHTFPDDPPRWEWKPILNPGDEFDADLVGASGWALNPKTSDEDVPFVHPFGFDWEFFIAPDSRYTSLLAPHNTGPDNEYREATRHAVEDLHLPIPNGVLGVETDQDLVPEDFRDWVRDGDRVAVFGRWIVDCGHEDFHTEIHPPLLLACARPVFPGHDPDHPQPGSSGVPEGTFVKIVSRPYLVSQEFGDGALKEHLIKEVAKVEGIIFIPLSTRVEAHPKIMPKPFSGVHLINLIVRPPSPRKQPGDKLLVSFHFTVRSGCAVQVYNAGSESVGILIVLNDVGYRQPPLPPKRDWNVTLDDIDRLDPDLGNLLRNVIFVNVLANPAAAAILARGILTDRYDAPRASSAHDSENVALAVPVENLRSNMGVSLGDDQPFPIYGWLNVGWKRDLSGVAPRPRPDI